jgi:hypothetical protein
MRAKFEPLAQWKTRKGLKTKILSTSDSEIQNQSGEDLAAKIRNYLVEVVPLGLRWVLLAGDPDNGTPADYRVPCREMFCDYTPETSSVPDKAPCDLYFSGLDGTWNANGNSLYGETEDEVDLYPDAWVGRASVSTPGEAETFVSKVLRYERDDLPWASYLSKILLIAPPADQPMQKAKALIRDDILPGMGFDVKDYNNWNSSQTTRDNVVADLGQGYHIVNWCLHSFLGSWHQNVYVENANHMITPSHLNGLANGIRQSILFACSAYDGAFFYSDAPSEDCLAEYFMNNDGGGGLAFIGHSAYGY